ncbi:GNAT family N-acetyltransferase [Actinacidiphila acidipaludis]|uniref:GNAT family N-acetyltransferase n=1 Tax=Actinacidiphila acidipaludis TaxID=2873382 RepID=A0ABS7Q453_9ACTN|nr:GNAT family N-acetyltransferase [Streptomyces acidipaludis]MBY8877902.1 GNAT family N-acetyltransferase [Streptomyces acidipaludis]
MDDGIRTDETAADPRTGTRDGASGAWHEDGITVVPANEVTWDDLTLVLGTARCHGGLCFCQRFKAPTPEWREVDDGERAHRLRTQTECGQPGAAATSGLVALVDGEPVGWCAVEPRTAYPKLRGTRIPWAGRQEDRDDPSVWAVTCFVVRAPARRTGATHVLARAAADFARRRGARAVEVSRWSLSPARTCRGGNCTSARRARSPPRASPR